MHDEFRQKVRTHTDCVGAFIKTPSHQIVELLQLAGLDFAIVDAECEHADSDLNLGYFFIARRFRGRGLGSAAVRQLFRLHRGNWEIYHLAANHAAGAFWQRVLAACAVDRLESSARTIHGEACVLFRFKV